MPSNLLKNYNERLELLYTSHKDNLNSLRSVFNRDMNGFTGLELEGMPIKPTTADGEDTMDRLFRHLTTIVTDKNTKKREFETERSIRIHWIKYHLTNDQKDKIVFTVIDEKRVYVLDKAERYVIVFEPMRNEKAFYLLTAYPLLPASYKAVMTKMEKRGKLGIQ